MGLSSGWGVLQEIGVGYRVLEGICGVYSRLSGIE
jgi:hypothetical protein